MILNQFFVPFSISNLFNIKEKLFISDKRVERILSWNIVRNWTRYIIFLGSKDGISGTKVNRKITIQVCTYHIYLSLCLNSYY